MREGFLKPACVIVKHTNPCGVAVVPEDEGGIRKAYDLAYATDSESAFAASSPSTASWTAKPPRPSSSASSSR